jgi:Fungal protein kinase
METKRHHVINMQELYNPATFLDSSCFSELYLPSHNSSDNISSYYNLSNRMSIPQRKTKAIIARKRQRPPIIAGMQATPIPPLGCSTQQRILSEAIHPSAEQSVTPLLLQAGQIPGKRAPSTILGSVLAKELKNDTVTASDTFIVRLFPKERAPLLIDYNFNSPLLKALAKKNYWNIKAQVFEGMSFTESGMGDWLNEIGKTMGEVYNRPLKRLWWDGTHNLPPSGAPHNRKPDLVLLTREYHETIEDNQRIDWRRIRSFGEVTSEKRMPMRMEETINTKSYLLFLLQFDRRFASALSFCSSGDYWFTLTDREGQIHYKSSLKSPGLEAAQHFLTILAFLMFGDDADIGLDPHFIRDDTDHLIAINIDNNRYELGDRIYAVESLLGRGTNVWVVTREDKQFILKDSWVLGDLVESEIVHLRAMIEHSEIESRVPTFADGGDVKINGITDSTANYRGHGLVGYHHNQRVHRRIVTGPVGTPLTTFRSKKEFVSALIDVVSGRCHRINHAIIFSLCT